MQELDKIIKNQIAALSSRPRDPGPCPAEEVLAGFLDGGLTGLEETAVREHLLECPSCLEAARIISRLAEDTAAEAERVPVKLLRKVMRLDPAKEGLWDIVIKFGQGVAEVIRGAGEAVSYTRAIPEMVRSEKQAVSETLVTFAKVFPPYKAEVEVEKVKPDRSEITVRVRELEGARPPRGLRVSMFAAARELESYLVDDEGQVVFENVRFGKYRLNIFQSGKEIGKISLNMKGEGSHGGSRHQG